MAAKFDWVTAVMYPAILLGAVEGFVIGGVIGSGLESSGIETALIGAVFGAVLSWFNSGLIGLIRAVRQRNEPD